MVLNVFRQTITIRTLRVMLTPCPTLTLSPCLTLTSSQFVDIPRVIESVMEAHKADFKARPSIEDIVNVSHEFTNSLPEEQLMLKY